MDPLHVTEWGSGEPVLLVHGTRSWGTRSFSAQEPLGELGYRLLAIDRRGFGRSPDAPREDFEQDARDLLELLGDGAHVVAHSYGALGALLAAGTRPEAIRSLVLIEPGTLSLARGRPEVERFLVEAEGFFANPTWATPEEVLVATGQAVGDPIEAPVLTVEERRGVLTSMRGRHVWEAELPVKKLGSPPFPSLVITGGRAGSERALIVRDALLAAADATAELLGAERLRIDDAGHSPHSERPEPVNAALLRVWAQSRP
jgi:pimeloyl-ACP methyl ester carboxylesterase